MRASEAQTANEKPKNKTRQLAFTVLKVLVSGGLIWFILRDTSLSEVWTAIQSANPWLLLLAFSLHFIGFLVSAIRWRGLLAAQDVDASIPFLFNSYVVSAFFNNLLPSTIGGDAVRAYDSWRLGQSKSDAVAVVFVDRFLGILVLMFFALVAILFSSTITEEAPSLYLWIVIGAVGVVVISWIMFVPSPRLPRLIERLPLPGKIKDKLANIVRAFLAFQGKKRVLAVALFWSAVLQANVVLHYWLISEAMGLGVPWYNFFLIVPLATFVMMIPISINGLGLRETVFAFFFAPFGVANSAAVAFSWIVYGMVVLLGVIGGVVYAMRRETRRAVAEERPAEIVPPVQSDATAS